MAQRVRLTIYDHGACIVRRITEHPSRAAALRSIRDYERRTDERWPHAIDALPMPDNASAEEWDDYKLAAGVCAR